jgi:hypothetical protein
MTPIILPPEINYVAAFLTLRCNLKCSYCINKFSDFQLQEEMSADDWIKGLSRITTRKDLPITLCGGEPTIHREFYKLVDGLQNKHMDLLTNGKFDLLNFMVNIDPDVFKRNAPYASIRLSYHAGMNEKRLVLLASFLQTSGYSVGIWGLDNNDNSSMKEICKLVGIDFRVKEYLDKNHGTYKYPEGLDGKRKLVSCKGSELLISPSGHIFKCHADLYANRFPLGHILDESIPNFEFRDCVNFGCCNPCDLKLKTNRLQEFGYCAVEIK